MAGRIEPERALALPDRQQVRRLTGASAFVARAARTIILRGCRSEIGAEAKAFVGQRNRPVRISLAGSDTVAEAGDKDVAHRDLGENALTAIRAGHVGGHHRGAAVADPQIDRFGAVEGGRLRAVAIIDRPGAGGADRHRAGQADHDRMIDRGEIAFLDVVAGAGLADAAGQIDAEPVHRVARPAAAVALDRQHLLRSQHAAAAAAFGMQQEIPLLAEQAEAVAHLPGNLQRPVAAGGLRLRGGRGYAGQRAGNQRDRQH